MTSRSFEEIRLPFLPGNQGGTRAAGAGASFANDNLPRLRTLCLDALRLAGRIAFLKARTVAQSGRTVATALNPNSFLMCQRDPSAVGVVAFAYPSALPVHRRASRVPRLEQCSSTGDCRDAYSQWSETNNADCC